MLHQISQKQLLHHLSYMWNLQTSNLYTRIEEWLLVAWVRSRGWGVVIKWYKLSLYKNERIIRINLQFSHFSSVQPLSRVRLFATSWTATHQASLSITNSWSILKLMFIVLVMPPNCLILFHPLLLPISIIPSFKVFSHESVLCIRWPKYWSFNINVSPSSEHPGLISFRMD